MIRGNDAVSPVVGVMLMLVVTIIIAAAVSGFASGFGDSAQVTPQACIEVKFTMPPYGNQSVFSNNGGDAFDLDDIKVVFQSHDTKATLSALDVGTNCIAFEKVGDNSDDLIKPGDSFIVVGTGSTDWAGNPLMYYGGFAMYPDKKIEWSVIDSATGNMIASGTELL